MAKQAIVIGIDPGLTGAVAVLKGRSVLFFDTPMVMVKSSGKTRNRYVPEQMASTLAQYQDIRGEGDPLVIAIERSRPMPKQGVTSTFSVGYGAGLWRGIIAALGFECVEVEPAQWKKEMLGGTAGQDKNASILCACKKFPAAAAMLMRAKDHGRADALLIAAYVQQKRR
jgi:Holliday junction resolvasome RuvABC endonuclease subunit